MGSRLRSNLLRWIGGGVQLRPADAVVLASTAMLVGGIPIVVGQYLIVSDPADIPYLDRSVAAWFYWFNGTIVLPLWFGFLLAGLVARKYWPSGVLLPHALCQAFALHTGTVAYLTGPFSDLSAVTLVFLGAVGGMILFESRIVRPALVTVVLAILAVTIAEQLGAIPYAPLFTGLQLAEGRYASSQLLGPSGVNFVLVILAAFFLIAVMGRLRRATILIRRYVPDQLAEKILAGEHTATSQPQRRKLTLFFSDVVGFTAASDQMEAEDLLELLNEYIREMSAIANEFGATIDSFVGDGIMMFFGAPERTNDKDHAVRAVRMALAMQHRMGELREKWLSDGVRTPFEIRIGIHSGMASVGDFGSEGRTTYSAIGTQVNLTARIQTECVPGRVLVSYTTWALIQDEIPCEDRGEVDLKGLRDPVRIYEVMDTASPHFRRVKDRS